MTDHPDVALAAAVQRLQVARAAERAAAAEVRELVLQRLAAGASERSLVAATGIARDSIRKWRAAEGG